MNHVPVLVIIFNRPDLTKMVLDQLRTVKPAKLYIAADGPRDGNETDSDRCFLARKTMEDIDWDCTVKKLFRDENLGCGRAVSSAISWFFDNEEYGIILEDDCLPNSSFFSFCAQLLERYKDNSQVFSINGFNFLGRSTFNESYCFSKYNLIWGWAAWRRSWRYYQFIVDPESEVEKTLADVFQGDMVSRRSWRKHLAQVRNGETDTWDYQWLYSSWKAGGIHIVPKNNLVKNIGFRPDGTHYTADDRFSKVPVSSIESHLIHPRTIKINKKLDRKIAKDRFGNSLRKFMIAFVRREIRKILKFC